MVLETDHTVILGWSEQIFTVLHELVEANANRRRPSIVILAEYDKVKMEDEIREKVPDTRNTRVVCRTGSPIDPVDLGIVNLDGARSIVILSPAGDDPDAEVIKTVLAITNGPGRRAEPYHIVAEIHERKNMEAARLVGGEEAQLVETGDIISRVIVQTCRQSGLSVVYTELLDFGGDEIYFQEEPALTGKTFGGALLAYEDSAVIGLQFQDGRTALNPRTTTPCGCPA
jgi:voltage-gated potassium channel Kch